MPTDCFKHETHLAAVAASTEMVAVAGLGKNEKKNRKPDGIPLPFQKVPAGQSRFEKRTSQIKRTPFQCLRLA